MLLLLYSNKYNKCKQVSDMNCWTILIYFFWRSFLYWLFLIPRNKFLMQQKSTKIV